jgi:hypothetical protein
MLYIQLLIQHVILDTTVDADWVGVFGQVLVVLLAHVLEI